MHCLNPNLKLSERCFTHMYKYPKILKNIFLLALTAYFIGCSAALRPCNLGDKQLKNIERARGLSFERSVPCQYLEPEQIVQELKAVLFEKNSTEELRHEELLYRMLGAIPFDYNYVEGLLSGYSNSIRGFYHTDKNYFALSKKVGPAGAQSVISHELVHALQDQNFDLSGLLPKGISSDSLMARQAVFEGDALRTLEALESEFNCRWHGKNVDLVNAERVYLSEDYAKFPPFLRLMAGFPYTHGVRFFCGLKEIDADFDFDSLFNKPPVSTAEVLDPSLYFKRLRPGSSSIREIPPALAEKGWEYTAVLGQYALFSLLAPDAGFRVALDATDGWVSDRIWIYKSPEEIELDFVSRWQSRADATEFFEGWKRVLRKDGARNEVAELGKFEVQLGERNIRLEIEGIEVRSTISANVSPDN